VKVFLSPFLPSFSVWRSPSSSMMQFSPKRHEIQISFVLTLIFALSPGSSCFLKDVPLMGPGFLISFLPNVPFPLVLFRFFCLASFYASPLWPLYRLFALRTSVPPLPLFSSAAKKLSARCGFSRVSGSSIFLPSPLFLLLDFSLRILPSRTLD